MAGEVKKRFEPTEEFKALVDDIRDRVKETADGAYAYGVVDALAFVWAGMPEDAGELYRGTNGHFAELAREAGI